MNYARTFSRQGKLHDHKTKYFSFRERSESPRTKITAEEAEIELKKVQKELSISMSKIVRSKKLTSSFLTLSREKSEKLYVKFI